MNKFNFQTIKAAMFVGLIFISWFVVTDISLARQRDIEYKIKAGYIYNFTKFISWPENESVTFNLCILGHDPFGSIIDPIEKRSVKNKPIRLYRLQSIKNAKHCHIIYVAKGNKHQRQLGLSLPGVLTINSIKDNFETKHNTQMGEMIAFFLRDGKVKLQINLKALRKSGLDVSAKLLEVAVVLEGDEDE